jgi:class 3 adenylate cyclase
MGGGALTAPRRTRLARWLLAAGNPLDWEPAGKVVVAAILTLPFTLWYWGVEYVVMHYPALAPYLDEEFIPVALGFQTAYVLVWAGIAILARVLRHRPEAIRALTVLAVEIYFVGFAFASYYAGHYTVPFGAAAGLTGAIIVILLFEGHIAAIGILSFSAVVVATTALEQAGVIPYGPFFRGTPIEGGQLSTLYLLLHGIPMFGVLAVGCLVAFYIVERWRDKDAKLEQTSGQLARANEVISRYVATQIAQQILAGNHAFLDRHERRRLTLFFSDIKDFAEIADHVEPEEFSEVLNEYLAEMALIAERHGGTIDKFVGDAVMILFGAPTATHERDHAMRAVVMALEMQRRIGELCDKWARDGFDRRFVVRMGINTGHATIGSFGSRVRLDYTAIGRQVNLAARLQAVCPPGRVLLSHATWVLVRDAIACEPKGEIQVKGFADPVKVYEVVGAAPRSEERFSSVG